MKKTREPIVLTVNGKAEMVVHDAESYDDFLRKLIGLRPSRAFGAASLI